jgi:hypothetical protein
MHGSDVGLPVDTAADEDASDVPLPAMPARSARWLTAQAALRARGVQGPTALESATSIRGLDALRRHVAPGDWVDLLAEALPPMPTGRLTSLSAWLRAGAGGDLLPRYEDDERFRGARAAADRIVDLFPTIEVSSVTDDWLDTVAVRRLEAKLAPGTSKATLRWLRRWAVAGRASCGLSGPVGRRWSWPRGDDVVGEDLPTVAALDVLLRHADARLALVLELIVAARLLPAQIARLGPTGFDAGGRAVTIAAGKGRGASVGSVRLALPGWTVDRHGAAAATVAFSPEDLHAAARRLRRLAGRHGLPLVTLLDLRRLGQSVAYAVGCARATIRGVVVARDPRLARQVEREQAQLVERWSTPSRPPVEPIPVPGHAPPRCPLDVPELGWEGAAA